MRLGRGTRASPPVGRLLSVHHRQVHVLVEGTGPDLVLLHGASGNLREFTFDLIGRLAPRYRCIAFDRPGLGHSDRLHAHGESPAEQADHLAAAAHLLDVRRPVLVGQSYGAAVALAWALRHPGEVSAVVSLAGASMPWTGGLDPWYRIASARLTGPVIVGAVAPLVPHSRTQAILARIFAPQPVPAGYGEHIGIDLALRPATMLANVRQVNGLLPHVTAMASDYPRLDLPVEILHGTADTIVPAEVHAVPLSTTLPDAQLSLLEGVGHMPHHADPEATVAAIDRAVLRAGLR